MKYELRFTDSAISEPNIEKQRLEHGHRSFGSKFGHQATEALTTRHRLLQESRDDSGQHFKIELGICSSLTPGCFCCSISPDLKWYGFSANGHGKVFIGRHPMNSQKSFRKERKFIKGRYAFLRVLVISASGIPC